MIKALAAVLLAIIGIPILILVSVMLSVGASTQALANPLDPTPSAFALEDIPADLLTHYQQAARSCPGLPWTVLAGIGKVESDHGRFGGSNLEPDGFVNPPIYGPLLDGSVPGTMVIRLGPQGSPWHGHPTFDRGLGPMQFLTDTFTSYGVDGNGDGERSPHNAFDAVHSSANYLCGSEGEVTDLKKAVFKYNRSSVYVNHVLDFATRYGVAPIYAGSDPLALVNHPNVSMGQAQRDDLVAGIIDPQLIAILLSLAQEHTFHLSSLQTGHSLCIARTGSYPNCKISRHASGRAADISMFDGSVVSDANEQALEQLKIWLEMDRETNYLRPWTIGHPFNHLDGAGPGSFNDADHENHFHLAVVGSLNRPDPPNRR